MATAECNYFSGGGVHEANEFDTCDPTYYTQSSYWSYQGADCNFAKVFTTKWGSGAGNGEKAMFANGSDTGYWRASFPKRYIDKMRFYAVTDSGYSWYCDLMVSKDNGTTWETLGRYTFDNTNTHIWTANYTPAKTDPYIDMEIKDTITDFKLDFPAQTYKLMVVNQYAVVCMRAVYFM